MKLTEGDITRIIEKVNKILFSINSQVVTRVELKNNDRSYRMLISKFRNY